MGKCLYCQSAHPFAKCNRIVAMSLTERVAVANKLRLCFHCCDVGHNAKNCAEKRNVTCTVCIRKGHIALFHGRQHLPPSSLSEDQRRNGGKGNDADPKIVNPASTEAAAGNPSGKSTGSESESAEETENPPI